MFGMRNAVRSQIGKLLDGGKCPARGTRRIRGLSQVVVLLAEKWKTGDFIYQMSCRCTT